MSSEGLAKEDAIKVSVPQWLRIGRAMTHALRASAKEGFSSPMPPEWLRIAELCEDEGWEAIELVKPVPQTE